MNFKHINNLDIDKDVILPCRKGDLDHLKNYIDLDKPDFEGEFLSFLTLYGKNGNRIYLLGLGESKDKTKIDQAFNKLCFENKKYWSKPIQLETGLLSENEIKKAAIGLVLGTYEIGQFKSEKAKQNDLTVEFVSALKIDTILDEARLIGETTNRIKALVDAPSNIKTPEYLGQWAKESAALNNYKCSILDVEALKKNKFEAVLAVGKGSENPPVVIISEYTPKSGSKIDVGLVGKGITFDTGGLSIKPSQNLHYMKSDMGGAAVVLGIVELVAKLNLNVNVVGVVASAENAVDAKSYRPGDVIDSYSGKTIEIIDTDAEGRLVLADGLSFINKEFKPECLIDLATLTGSVVRTLGYSAAGMFTNNSDLAESMRKCGEKVHERVWPLPLFEDFESDLHSDIADIRNFSGKPIAGAINAAKFLESFTDSHKKWMHLDIAGVSFGDSKYAKMKSATGYGIQLITEFIKTLT